MILETSVDRSVAFRNADEFRGFRRRCSHLLGEPASCPCARPARRAALLLVLAGNDHAASSRLAVHLANHAHVLDQLRFLG
ncbi:MAG: hypothetical protein BWY57_02306 [Betaproteobacteria bacterium ADurb.Bin341]|nr:MAG: hypothetical protein BWY57_02306 [Betaproteobacteria bacterium ADurb.Bin341]